MNPQMLAIGVMSLIGIVVLAVMLAGRRTTRTSTIDSAQVARTLQAAQNLKHNGVWQTPRLSASDKRLFKL